MIELFHFLRPAWLLLLVPLLLLFWLLLRATHAAGSWRGIVDAELLPYVLTGDDAKRRSRLRWLLLAAAVLAVLALAGPTWEKLPQPVYHKNRSSAITIDLSRSMNVNDVKPSRLERARHKIADILNLKMEGQSALVVYAADAFAVTPLTTDIETILTLLPGLETELMPAQGTRADRAVALGFELLANAGVVRGDVLLVSDGLGQLELDGIEALQRQHGGHRLSVLAVGTAEGGPIPLGSGGFLTAGDGSIVIARLQEENLRRLADSGGGVFATLSADDIDINTIGYLFETSIDEREATLSDRSADLWRELGPWLILLSLPLAALAFRRGMIWMLALHLVLLPPAADAADWDVLWQNRDQRASELFDQGRHGEAAELFDDPQWRAASKYREGDYAAALEAWQQQDDERARYNRGNALAGMGRYEEALEAYASLLERNPEHADARFNKKAIEDWLRQQQSGQEQSPQGDTGQQPQSDDGQAQAQAQPQSQEEEQPQSAEQNQSQQAQPEQQPEPAEGASDEARAEPPAREADAQRGESAEPEEQLARIDEQMSEQAEQQWLRKIPDDPGGLLRRKFLYQYRQRGGVDSEAQAW